MTPIIPLIDKVDHRSLRSGFLASALAHPDAPALIVGDVVRSYGEVLQEAVAWTERILRSLGRPPERVGVFAYRSEVAYSGVLAALFCGSAFVPLNRTFPIERTRAMVRLAKLDVIIVDEPSAAQLEHVLMGLDDAPVVIGPDTQRRTTQEVRGATAASDRRRSLAPDLSLLPPVLPDDIAYLLFTSGSTGIPKGVPVTHRNVLHFIDVMTNRYRFGREDRFSQTFDQTFDLSVFDLFVAWQCGACVCAMQPLDLLAPARFVAKHGVTVWFSVPSIPALMRKKSLLKPNSFPTLRWSLFCGESLPQVSAEAWQVAAPNSVIENLYGPTELTIACLNYRWDPQRSPDQCLNGLVPIGRPFPGLGAMVVDENLQPVSPGETGELCVTGPQTVPGYWQDPTRTAERFVSLPMSNSTQHRFYRTGDRVSRLPQGDYVHLGRTDDQIKVLGHRVELGEIEAALRNHPQVIDAVALGWPIENGTAEGIKAFVTGTNVEPDRLVANLRRGLPSYMVPQEILTLEFMPLNANGKVDRKALVRRLEQRRVPVGFEGGVV